MRAIPSTATPCSIIRMSLTDRWQTHNSTNTREKPHNTTWWAPISLLHPSYLCLFVFLSLSSSCPCCRSVHCRYAAAAAPSDVTGAWDTDRRTVRCVFYTKRVSWESTDSPAYAQTSTNVLPKLRKGSGTTWRAARVVRSPSPLPAFNIYI